MVGASGVALGTVLLGIAALASAVISFLMWRSTRQGSEDANKIAEEATRISERETDLAIMNSTMGTLRASLQDAQQETDKLREDLGEARKETRALQDEVNTALANVAILSDHIREHVPNEVPFPRLRRVPRSA